MQWNFCGRRLFGRNMIAAYELRMFIKGGKIDQGNFWPGPIAQKPRLEAASNPHLRPAGGVAAFLKMLTYLKYAARFRMLHMALALQT